MIDTLAIALALSCSCSCSFLLLLFLLLLLLLLLFLALALPLAIYMYNTGRGAIVCQAREHGLCARRAVYVPPSSTAGRRGRLYGGKGKFFFLVQTNNNKQ
jgi:hypothetical protein